MVARDEAATFGGVSGYCRAELDMYDAMGMIDTYLDSHAHTGSWSGVFDRLEPGSPYEAYAVGVDDRGAFTTPFTERSFVAGAAGRSGRAYAPCRVAARHAANGGSACGHSVFTSREIDPKHESAPFTDVTSRP